MGKIFRFTAEVEGDVYSRETFPIYDDECKQLLGGFSLVQGELVLGFIAGTEHPAALYVSTGAPFYFTPRDDKNGNVSFGVISEAPISPLSVKIPKAYEEPTNG